MLCLSGRKVGACRAPLFEGAAIRAGNMEGTRLLAAWKQREAEEGDGVPVLPSGAHLTSGLHFLLLGPFLKFHHPIVPTVAAGLQHRSWKSQILPVCNRKDREAGRQAGLVRPAFTAAEAYLGSIPTSTITQIRHLNNLESCVFPCQFRAGHVWPRKQRPRKQAREDSASSVQHTGT